MKFSYVSIFAILCIVIAVTFAGCTSTSPTTTSTIPTASSTTGNNAPAASSTTSAPSAGSVVSGKSILGNTNYNWVEYKSVVKSGGDTMTILTKFEKSGACTMKMTSATMQITVDCSAKGNQDTSQQSNPNDVQPDVKFTFVTIEPVTVPAGTYPMASKYSVTTPEQGTVYFWTAPGVPGFVKYEIKTTDGIGTVELNGWG